MPEEPVVQDGPPCARGNRANRNAVKIPKRAERRTRDETPDAPIARGPLGIRSGMGTRNGNSFFFSNAALPRTLFGWMRRNEAMIARERGLYPRPERPDAGRAVIKPTAPGPHPSQK